MDKYDDMPDEELAAKTLAMMGYTQYYPSLWMNNGVVHKEWQTGNILFSPESHAFATEVKGWMRRRGWFCVDVTRPTDAIDIGSQVDFWKYVGIGENELQIIGDLVDYRDMAAHPRAVCIAALRATEKEAEEA